MVFEVVLENSKEALVAEKYGARRIELCSSLELGGVTPSYGIIENCLNVCNVEIHTMIRPRPGGFVYSDDEITVMKRDVKQAFMMGCKGIVFGVLDENSMIDKYYLSTLTNLAKSFGLEVTFHRAIDFCADYRKGIDTLIEMGIDRILTSGKGETVDQGLDILSQIPFWTEGKIQIMAGGGVNQINAEVLIKMNIDAIHFNIRKHKLKYQISPMGMEYEIDENKIIGISNLF